MSAAVMEKSRSLIQFPTYSDINERREARIILVRKHRTLQIRAIYIFPIFTSKKHTASVVVEPTYTTIHISS